MPARSAAVLVVAYVLLISISFPDSLAGGPKALSRYGVSPALRAPMVGNTRFMPNTLLPDPFIRTAFKTGMGLGKAPDLTVPLFEIGGEPVFGLEGDLYYALLDMQFKYAAQDWVTLTARGQAAARLGTELQVLLAQGVSLVRGYNIGWLVRAYESDRHLLSFGFSVTNAKTTVVDFYGFIHDAIEDGGISPDNKIVRTVPTLATIIDLRYALATTDVLGLQALGRVGYGESAFRGQGMEWRYELGLAAHIDLYSHTDLPVGFVLGYRHGLIPEGDEVAGLHGNAAILNVAYTGRRDFGLNLGLRYERLPLDRLLDPANIYFFLVDMWYYF